MELGRILVPVDGSSCSRRAVRESIALAEACGSRLTFLSVIDDPLRGLHGISESMGTYEDVLSALKRAGREALEAAAAAAAAAGVPAACRLVSGRAPVDAILETERDHDLTVLGTHGRHGVSRAFLGSVTEGVLRQSRLPHLVVRCGAGECGDSS